MAKTDGSGEIDYKKMLRMEEEIYMKQHQMNLPEIKVREGRIVNEDAFIKRIQDGLDGYGAQGREGLSSPRDFANELKYYYKYNSRTDYHLSKDRFDDVYNQALQNNAIQWNKSMRLANGNYSIPVDFYKTNYDFAFGRATMTFSFDKVNGFIPVGFNDIWDLDIKAWGIRSYFNEGVTRYYNWQLNGGTPFKITYP